MRFFCSLIISFVFIFSAQAQAVKKVTKSAVITPVVKFKPPVVKTFLGRNTGDAVVTLEEANQLINLPLKIADDKNNTYTISSYQFMYKKKSVIENEETNKKEIVFTTVGDVFKTTPLPKIWQDNIGGGIQKDEELFFFDVVVNDKQGRKFFAPNVKIIVK